MILFSVPTFVDSFKSLSMGLSCVGCKSDSNVLESINWSTVRFLNQYHRPFSHSVIIHSIASLFRSDWLGTCWILFIHGKPDAFAFVVRAIERIGCIGCCHPTMPTVLFVMHHDIVLAIGGRHRHLLPRCCGILATCSAEASSWLLDRSPMSCLAMWATPIRS